MSDLVDLVKDLARTCDDCGETGRPKAAATYTHQQMYGAKFTQTLYFCHDEEKSCYLYVLQKAEGYRPVG